MYLRHLDLSTWNDFSTLDKDKKNHSIFITIKITKYHIYMRIVNFAYNFQINYANKKWSTKLLVFHT